MSRLWIDAAKQHPGWQGATLRQREIRVENPFELAEILLGRDGWTQERFSEVLDSGKERTVFLSEPVPVLLLYWTAQASPDGTVSFFRDVYERDQAIVDAPGAPFVLDLPGESE